MINDEILDKIIGPELEKHQAMAEIVGMGFNKCFREIKYFNKKGGFNDSYTKDLLLDVDKKDIIIFSPNKKKIDSLCETKKKIFTPFDKIFIEYPILNIREDTEGNNVYVEFTNGFFINTIKGDDENINAIFIFSIWMDYGKNKENQVEEGITPNCVLVPYDKLNGELKFDAVESKRNEHIGRTAIEIFKKICHLIQSKQYNEYYKWTPGGIQKKEVVYSHDVKSHKRHFWTDSGKYKIPLLSKEEILSRGYGIDEIVFRGYQIRRDVPYIIISTYKVGDDKPKKENNKIINLLKKRIFKNEEKLGLLLSEIFPNQYIKKNDRRRIKPLELDYYIHNLNLAFEYDGEQHFKKEVCEEIFKSNFKEQQKRDRKKNHICRKKGIFLIRIKYDEPLNKTYIKRILKQNGYL